MNETGGRAGRAGRPAFTHHGEVFIGLQQNFRGRGEQLQAEDASMKKQDTFRQTGRQTDRQEPEDGRTRGTRLTQQDGQQPEASSPSSGRHVSSLILHDDIAAR